MTTSPGPSDELGAREAELRAQRRANLATLHAHGVDPFKATRFAV